MLALNALINERSHQPTPPPLPPPTPPPSPPPQPQPPPPLRDYPGPARGSSNYVFEEPGNILRELQMWKLDNPAVNMRALKTMAILLKRLNVIHIQNTNFVMESNSDFTSTIAKLGNYEYLAFDLIPIFKAIIYELNSNDIFVPETIVLGLSSDGVTPGNLFKFLSLKKFIPSFLGLIIYTFSDYNQFKYSFNILLA